MIPRSVLALLSSVMFTPHLAAAIFTVGPDGVYNSLQDAFDAAIVAGGHQEIRVQAGTYHENLSILSSDFAGTLSIFGGWNEDFSSSSANAESTTIDGNQAGRPLTLEISGGAILIESITFSNGLVGDTLPFGGGVDARLTGNAVFRMENCSISGNSVVSHSQAWGGGVSVWTRGSSELHLSRVSVIDNIADCSSGGGSGGLYIVASDSSVVAISSAIIERNSVQTKNVGAIIQYGGIAVFGDDDSTVAIEDTLVRANSLEGSSNVWASGAQLDGGQSLTVRRCRFIDNSAELSGNVYQTVIRRGQFSDSIVAGGNANGLYIGGNDISVQATNLTIADAPGTGLNLYVGTNSHIAIFNSIAFGNMVDLEISRSSTGILDMDFNLIGIDPRFVEPASQDYHLLIGSQAENAGTNSPPGDLGPLDCDGGPRIIDLIADIGAYEGVSEIFIDGFESSTTEAWSRVLPGTIDSNSTDDVGAGVVSSSNWGSGLTESFQADRNPRERGLRPLNANR